MSKITNLIGTTWRLDYSNLDSVTADYGAFNITSYGVGIVDGILADCQSVGILVGIAGFNEASLRPIASVVTIYYDEVSATVDGEVINVTDVFAPYGGEGVYAGYYEFTITGGTDISNPLFIDFINTYGTLVSGGEPPTAEGVKEKLQSLLTASNAKTGKSDANLTDAVKTLLEGYGQGGGGGASVLGLRKFNDTITKEFVGVVKADDDMEYYQINQQNPIVCDITFFDIPFTDALLYPIRYKTATTEMLMVLLTSGEMRDAAYSKTDDGSMTFDMLSGSELNIKDAGRFTDWLLANTTAVE